MYQAIITTYLGATNTRGSRIKAVAEAANMAVPYPHEAGSVSAAHLVAAKALATKMGWAGIWVGGGHEKGYAFVRLQAGSDVREGNGIASLLVAFEQDRSWFVVPDAD